MQTLGASNIMIMNQMGITERNFYDTYVPKLNQMWRDIWLKKSEVEKFKNAQQFEERLNSAYTNARTKAREEDASPGWGQLEQELSMLLFQCTNESVDAIEKLRQLERKASQLDESRSEQGALILQEHPADQQSDQGDGSDKQ